MTYSCELSKRLIRAGASGPMDTLTAKIKKIVGYFQLDDEGELSSVKFTVTRENPMLSMMNGDNSFGDGVKVQGHDLDGLSPSMREQIEASMTADDSVTYILKKKSKASARSKKKLEEMRDLAGEV